MSKINALPRGLQEFLGNTSQGVNPADLSQVVTPQIGLLPFWAADKMRNIIATANVGAFGSGVEIEVPEGEAWIPIVASTDTFAAAGEVYKVGLQLTDAAGNARSVLAQSQQYSAVSVAQVGCNIVFPMQIVIPSGWVFRGQVDEFGGSTPTISLDLTYIELKA